MIDTPVPVQHSPQARVLPTRVMPLDLQIQVQRVGPAAAPRVLQVHTPDSSALRAELLAGLPAPQAFIPQALL
jgi:hypothetical protein